MDYEVYWSVAIEGVEGKTPQEALMEAFGDLENFVKFGDGATIMVVRRGEEQWVYDLEDHDPEQI